MKITIQYAAQARHATGCAGETLEFSEPPTVLDVLRQVVARHPEVRPICLTADGGPQLALLVFVNDIQIRPDAPQSLQDGTAVTLLPPIAGG